MPGHRRWFAPAVSVAMAAGCGWFGDDIGFHGSYEESPGLLVVELSVRT
jgi:hypothetical protein